MYYRQRCIQIQAAQYTGTESVMGLRDLVPGLRIEEDPSGTHATVIVGPTHTILVKKGEWLINDAGGPAVLNDQVFRALYEVM